MNGDVQRCARVGAEVLVLAISLVPCDSASLRADPAWPEVLGAGRGVSHGGGGGLLRAGSPGLISLPALFSARSHPSGSEGLQDTQGRPGAGTPEPGTLEPEPVLSPATPPTHLSPGYCC